jgi:hypothetical protein
MEIEGAIIQANAVWGSEDLRDRRAELAGRLQGFGKTDALANLSMAERVAIWRREQEQILSPTHTGGSPASSSTVAGDSGNGSPVVESSR